MPRTLFGRNLLLIVALVAIAQASFALAFVLQVQRPRLERYVEYVAVVATSFGNAIDRLAPADRQAFIDSTNASARGGLAIERAGAPVPAGRRERLLRYLQERITQRLPDREIGFTELPDRRLWVSLGARDGHTTWLVLRIGDLAPDVPTVLVASSLMTALISVIGAALIQRRITRPLRDLERAAGEVASGRHPAPVPDEGTDELATVAKSFNRMAEHLSRIERERALMLAGISHDLRTPLTKLWLGLEMLGPEVDASLREQMVGSIEAANRIIDQFIGYARGLEGESIEEVDLDAIVSRVVTSASSCLPVHRTGNAGRMRGRPVAIERAVANLIENACRYGREVEVRTRGEPHDILIDVMDRGPGIDAASLARVREPFVRLDDARASATGGAGLGLAIADRVARLHDGRLDLQNREGGGLVATLRLSRG